MGMYCPKCGTELNDDADFCYNCGERFPTAPRPSPKKLRCPGCGSTNFETITETYDETKGYNCCNGILGYLLLGPVGWLCGACGMGKGKTTTTTCFLCKDCGTKFR